MDIKMPQLGESVTEGTITKWLKKTGDIVEKYEPICEVATDKVNAEVPSSIGGTIIEIIASEGETIEVGKLICRIQEEGASVIPILQDRSVKEELEEEGKPIEKNKRYSPAVLRLAQENDLDLTRVNGTGRGGRITRKDVLKVLGGSVPSSVQKPTIVEAAPEKGRDLSLPTVATPKSGELLDTGDTEVLLTPIRKTIAERMVRSKQEIPHAWLMMEADVTGLVKLRGQFKEEFKQREGVHLTFIPFFIKAVVDALKEFPQLNSVWAENKIILKKQINISLAVGTEDALFVPVIHKADEKSILGLAKDVAHLIEKTRAGKLALSDMQGGTFTVNNTGSFGSILSTPIINHPQAAILSFESIVKRPVIVEEMIAIRDRMNLCLSIDHRIVDGFIAGRFLQRVKERLESYQKEDVI